MRNNSIQSLERAGRVLALFTPDRPVLRVTDASRSLGLNRSTVSRLLSTLAQVGLVAPDESGVGYRPGPRVLALAQLATGRINLRAVALPVMRELGALTRESVGLQVRSGDHRVCIEQVASPQPLRWVAEIGVPLPLHAGSTGKILLAFVGEEEREAYLMRGLEPCTSRTITDASALRAELQRIRLAGYAISCDERAVNVSGVAAPVRDALGNVVAALVCSGPSSRWTREAMQARAPDMVGAARRISTALGYPAGERAAEGGGIA